MAFDPDQYLKGATAVVEPKEGAEPTSFDADSYLGGAPAARPAEVSENPTPSGTPNWGGLYSGLNGLDDRLTPEQRVAFGRLDKLIIESKLVPCPYCSEGDPGQCDACHNTCRVMLSQQHEYSLHIRPVPNAANRRFRHEARI